MAERQGGIYYQSIDDFDFDRTFAFLAKEFLYQTNLKMAKFLPLMK